VCTVGPKSRFDIISFESFDNLASDLSVSIIQKSIRFCFPTTGLSRVRKSE